MLFSPGTRLGPYEVLEPLGRGGMGEVYRAQDARLNRPVAIKIVLDAANATPDKRQRFEREARAVARLDHPHVCRLYDVGHDRGVDYLVLEYLEGETLASRIREGRLSEPEAVDIGRQIAEALHHIHRHGLVHRDLKPGNIVLTPRGAKLLDFGLAKWLTGSDDPLGATSSTLVGVGSVAGTLLYMAPEQIDGEAVDERCDVFALGVILYEMLAGRSPFVFDTPSATVAAILAGQPPPLHAIVPGISDPLAMIVAKCLEKRPVDRWQTAGALASALRAPTDATRAIRAPRRSIAVLGFRNLSGRTEVAWLSTALAEMLTTELGASEQICAIAGENVARMKIELKLIDADGYAPDTLARIAKNLGSDLVAVGGYLVHRPTQSPKVRLDVRIQETRTGQTVASVAETSSEEDLLSLVSSVGRRVRDQLGILDLSPAQSAAVRAAVPSGTEAIRLYAQGLEQHRLFGPIAARDLLVKAVAADPTNALARSALAAAWSALGYDGKAREEAERAAQLSESLPREQRLAVQARYRALAGDTQEAIESYADLCQLYPDNLDYGLDLVRCQTSSGFAKDAAATLTRLRKLSHSFGDDPRLENAEALTQLTLGNFTAAHSAALSAIRKAAERGAGLLVAEAHRWNAVALSRMGRFEEALASAAEAHRLAREAGDRNLSAWAEIITANVLYFQRDLAGAKLAYERALTTMRSIGNQGVIAGTLLNIGNVVSDQGNYDGAIRAYDESLAISRELGHTKDVAFGLNNLANVTSWRGELRTAIELHEQAVVTCRQIDDRGSLATALMELAIDLREQAELSRVHASLDEALRLGGETGDRFATAGVLNLLATVLTDQDDFARALKLGEEALSLSRSMGAHGVEVRALLTLARLANESGDADRARTLADGALDRLKSVQAQNDWAAAYEMLAQAYLAAGKASAARAAIEQALSRPRQTYATRLSVAITASRVAASTSPPDAARQLRSAIEEAGQSGHIRLALEARLCLCDVEMRCGAATSAAALLTTLANDAAARGLALIARKARSALR